MGNISCHKSEASGSLKTRAYARGRFSISRGTQFNFGPLNPVKDEMKDRGKVYVVTLSAFQRCLEGGPDAEEQRPGRGFPTGRGKEDDHLEAHHDLQARPARPGKAT
ncbi:hypothetical protein MKX01_004647 [Papaver californicum]|nr:hypothetical protein MKX01_004647 [Papaver californicum]